MDAVFKGFEKQTKDLDSRGKLDIVIDQLHKLAHPGANSAVASPPPPKGKSKSKA